MKHNLLLIIVSCFLLCSCSRVYYPYALSVPALDEQGDVKLNLNVGASGMNGNLAVGITDNLGVFVNGNLFNLEVSYNNGPLQYLINESSELAIGYYVNTANNMFFDVFSGINYINTSGYLDEQNQNILMHGLRLFTQPTVGYKNTESQLLFSLKCGYVEFFEQKKPYSTNITIEPAVSFKYGGENIKGTVQFMHNEALLLDGNYLNANFMSFSLGLQVNLDGIIMNNF